KHPGIVPLLKTYLNAEPLCLEYEYVNRGDLAGFIHEWHRSGKKPSSEKAVKVISRLAEIIGFSHQLKPAIVHRDLKPANILVHQVREGKVDLRIADFGIGGVAANQAIQECVRKQTT